MRRVCRWQVRGAASVLASMANLKFTKVSVAGLQEVKRSSHFSACERSISCDAILLRISARGHRSARDSETPRADLDPAPPGCAFLRYPNVPLGSDRPPQRRIRGLSRQLGFSCLWPKPIGVPTPQYNQRILEAAEAAAATRGGVGAQPTDRFSMGGIVGSTD